METSKDDDEILALEERKRYEKSMEEHRKGKTVRLEDFKKTMK